MINGARRDFETSTQEYDFSIRNGSSWEIQYNSFSYFCEKDRKAGAVDSNLFIQDASLGKCARGKGATSLLHDTIYQTGDRVGTVSVDLLRHSPMLEKLNGLKPSVRDEITGELSPEARGLLERGLEYYDSIRRG